MTFLNDSKDKLVLDRIQKAVHLEYEIDSYSQ